MERRLFLSHSAVDSELAEFLESAVGDCVPGMKVFRTTRIGGIPSGKEWFEIIGKHLFSSDCYLVLLTPGSASKPWVCFETGAAWFSRRVLVPVLAGGLRPTEVPEPLRLLQLLSLEDPGQAEQAFKDLGGHLTNPDKFVARVRVLGELGRAKSLAERFRTIQFEGSSYAFEGPFAELREGDAVPMPDGLPAAFRKSGFEYVLGNPKYPESTLVAGFRRVWLLDEWNQKCPLLSRPQKQQLYVKESRKPLGENGG